jgi:hypothetical protein
MYDAYPNSIPEFRMLQKIDGTTIMQVRYINVSLGYTGKWMDIKMEKENDASNYTKPPSYI